MSLDSVPLVTKIDMLTLSSLQSVVKAIPKSEGECSESNPISDQTVAPIKERRRLRRQYSQIKDPPVKTRINQLQKHIKDDTGIQTQASWKKVCNSIRLEIDQSRSWHEIKNFLKPKGQHNCPTLRHDDKIAKTNADKMQPFAESVGRHRHRERQV